MNLVDCSYVYVAKINPTKILPLNTEFLVSVIINSYKLACLLKYFHHEPKQKPPILPDPKGSLSEKVPTSSIELNNIIYNIQNQA